jgi:hypothetical protein
MFAFTNTGTPCSETPRDRNRIRIHLDDRVQRRPGVVEIGDPAQEGTRDLLRGYVTGRDLVAQGERIPSRDVGVARRRRERRQRQQGRNGHYNA